MQCVKRAGWHNGDSVHPSPTADRKFDVRCSYVPHFHSVICYLTTIGDGPAVQTITRLLKILTARQKGLC